MRFNSLKNIWLRFSLRTRFLFCFLALSFISFGIISFVTISSIQDIGTFAGNNTSSLGLRAAKATEDALEIVGKQQLREKAYDVAKDVSIYFLQHPGIDPELIYRDLALFSFAVQHIGNTGYTFLYEETHVSRLEDAVIRLYPDPKFLNKKFSDLAEDQFKLHSLSLENGLMGAYYFWQESDGQSQFKFMYMLPVDQTAYVVPIDVTEYKFQTRESRYIIAAVINVSELRALSKDIQYQITSDSIEAKLFIEQQYNSVQNFLILALILTLCFSIGLAYWLAKTVTKPISSLTESSRIIARGNFEHRVDIKGGGEIDELASQFNMMASELQNSYADLEKKVEERTRSERRKTEHLQSVNEIGQKISSILNIEELFPFVVNSLDSTFHYNVHILLVDNQSKSIVSIYEARKNDHPVPIGLEIDEIEGLVSYVSRNREPMLINDITSEGQPGFRRNTNTKSEIAVPIIAGSRLLGIINIESEELNAFDEIDLFTARKVADQLAIAIINAQLYQEIRNSGIMEERNRLAREIHDTLAQGFAGIILQLEGADQVFSSDASRAREHLNRARQLARDSLNEARRSVWALRPQQLEKNSLIECIQIEVNNFIHDSGIEAKFESNGKQAYMTPGIENTLLLILRESLFNIRKHAKAGRVDIVLCHLPDEIELSIEDNGIGFNIDDIKENSFGLTSMKERALLFGGSLIIKSEKGNGTQISVKLPFFRKESHG
ncbi:MAG: histidine kinase [Dehalococcoidales bacterium]|nr:histidine kinase [Dehalococcoidales bacterium]